MITALLYQDMEPILTSNQIRDTSTLKTKRQGKVVSTSFSYLGDSVSDMLVNILFLLKSCVFKSYR